MKPRSQRSAPERHARSQLAQLLIELPFLRGSLVDRARSCGKPTCRCQKGQLHHSWYLAVNHCGQRALLYVPRALYETVRQWRAHGRRISQQRAALHPQQRAHLLQHQQRLRTRPAHLSSPPTEGCP